MSTGTNFLGYLDIFDGPTWLAAAATVLCAAVAMALAMGWTEWGGEGGRGESLVWSGLFSAAMAFIGQAGDEIAGCCSSKSSSGNGKKTFLVCNVRK